MVDLSGLDHKSIVERAKAIILTPKDEWPKIVAEPQTQGEILKGYVLPLAAIGPLSGLIAAIFGFGFFSFSYGSVFISLLASTIIRYGLTIGSVFLLTFLANALAPKFSGESNGLRAFQLIAYGYTAFWLAGIFWLIPTLAVFTLLGLYSIYLLYTGSTALLKVPQDQAVGFTGAIALAAIALALIITPITTRVTTLFTPTSIIVTDNDTAEVSGTVTVPGVGSIDLDKMQETTKRMEDAANGKVPAVETARIQALLPAAVGAYQRSATESMAVGAVGSSAQGTYTAGDKSFVLKISDIAALGALSGFGAAMGVQQSREDANGYDRTTTVNGEIQSESWNKSTGSGKFGITVKNRFLIEAEGSAASIDELKAAVSAVDQGTLASLAG